MWDAISGRARTNKKHTGGFQAEKKLKRKGKNRLARRVVARAACAL